MRADDEGVAATIRRLYRDVELAVREGTLLLDGDGRVVASHKAADWLGVDDASLVGGPPLPGGWTMTDQAGGVVDPADHPALVALRTGAPAEAILSVSPPDGGADRHLRFRAYPIDDEPDVAVDVAINDQELREQHRDTVEAHEARFRTLADVVPVAIYEAAITGEITYVNKTFTALTGLTVETVPDLPLLEIVHPDDLLAVMEAAGRAPEAGEYTAQYRITHIDGSSRWVRSQLGLLVGADGKMSGFVGSIEDIDDLRRSERLANRFADIVEASDDAVAVFEANRLVYLNRAATELLERTDEAFTSEPRTHVFSRQVLDGLGSDIGAKLLVDGEWTGEMELRDADGDPVMLSLMVTAEIDDRVQIGRTVLRARDIGEAKRREAVLTHEARHDPLTGLANRHSFSDSARTRARDAKAAVLYIDIDHFKRINDEHGHATGDSVLVEVARRLCSVVRTDDVVVRFGGDEIVVWAPSTTATDAEQLAGRLIAAVRDEPIRVGERSLAVTVTIGVAAGVAADETDLIKQADSALYRAKRTGRNRWVLADTATASG